MNSRVCAEIDLSAIRRNVKGLMSVTNEDTKAMAVVKTDAYGHGEIEVAKAVLEQVDAFAVATAQEALSLRNQGITKDILILGFVFPEDYEETIKNNIIFTVFDKEMAQELNNAALKLGSTAKCHIKVDTGMRRIGLEPNTAGLEIVKFINSLEAVEIKGIFTHFAKADEMDKTSAKAQYDKFTGFVDMVKQAGIDVGTVHCSNSAAIIDMPWANCDMVRLGVSLYGLYPSDEVNKRAVMLFPAMSIKSHITYVKTIEAGECISYGGTFKAERTMRVATVPVGYGDGYPRNLSNKGYVLINGKKARICGRVCMDQFMVDVTDIPEAKRFDEVVLLGKMGQECITVEELAAMAGTFNYEFVCDVGKRVPRVYVN